MKNEIYVDGVAVKDLLLSVFKEYETLLDLKQRLFDTLFEWEENKLLLDSHGHYFNENWYVSQQEKLTDQIDQSEDRISKLKHIANAVVDH